MEQMIRNHRQYAQLPDEEDLGVPALSNQSSATLAAYQASQSGSKASILHADSKRTEKKISTVGFKTPFYICILFLGGVIVAFDNYIFFRGLHNSQPVIETLPQSWLQTASHVYANLVRSLLGGALGIAYVQHLWRRFRKSWMRAKVIDQLLSLPWTPIGLFNFKTMWAAKFEWFFALFCVLLPLATAFPPGSIKVVMKELEPRNSEPIKFNAPWMNLTYRRDESYRSFELGALYRPEGHAGIQSVKPQIQEAITNVLRNGYITPWTDPQQGRNNSYEVSFTGPRIECFDLEVAKDTNFTNFEDVRYILNLDNYQTDEEKNASAFTIWYRREIITTPLPDYGKWLTKQTDFLKTRCYIGTADYHVKVKHSVGSEGSSISYTTDSFKPITEGPISYPSGKRHFYHMIHRDFTDEEAAGRRYLNYTTDARGRELPMVAYDYRRGSGEQKKGEPFYQQFLEQQCLAIFLGFMRSLEGVVRDFGSTKVASGVSSNILATRMANISSTETDEILILNISPELVQQAFENVTVSMPMFGIEGWSKEVNLTTNVWANVYHFTPLWLIAPYAAIIGLSFIFCLVGLFGLFRNGVSAKGSSFLQIVTTTSAGTTLLREKAAECFEGGGKSYSKELLDLRLKYGEFVAQAKGAEYGGYEKEELGVGRGTGVWGFGTVGEVATIKRR